MCVNFLRLFALRNLTKAQRNALLTDWLYWLEFAVTPFIGGVLTLAYGEAKCKLPGILPLHVGASAPAIFKVMGGAIPTGRGRSN